MLRKIYVLSLFVLIVSVVTSCSPTQKKRDVFSLPENWLNNELPESDLLMSFPNTWNNIVGIDQPYIYILSGDNFVKGMCGLVSNIFGKEFKDEFINLKSDDDRLSSLLSTFSFDNFAYYEDRSAYYEVCSQNIAYIVEYSVKEESEGDIIDKLDAFVVTPNNEVIFCNTVTTIDDYWQVDQSTILEIFGSIRSSEGGGN